MMHYIPPRTRWGSTALHYAPAGINKPWQLILLWKFFFFFLCVSPVLSSPLVPWWIPLPVCPPLLRPLGFDSCKQQSSIEVLSSPAPKRQQRLAAALNKRLSKVKQAGRTSARRKWWARRGQITGINCVSHTPPPQRWRWQCSRDGCYKQRSRLLPCPRLARGVEKLKEEALETKQHSKLQLRLYWLWKWREVGMLSKFQWKKLNCYCCCWRKQLSAI